MMQIAIVGFNAKGPKRARDNSWLGNTVGVAKLYGAGGKFLGQCFDTPNAIACAVKHCGAVRVVDGFGGAGKIDADRVAAGGWMSLEASGFKGA